MYDNDDDDDDGDVTPLFYWCIFSCGMSVDVPYRRQTLLVQALRRCCFNMKLSVPPNMSVECVELN